MNTTIHTPLAITVGQACYLDARYYSSWGDGPNYTKATVVKVTPSGMVDVVSAHQMVEGKPSPGARVIRFKNTRWGWEQLGQEYGRKYRLNFDVGGIEAAEGIKARTHEASKALYVLHETIGSGFQHQRHCKEDLAALAIELGQQLRAAEAAIAAI